MIGERATGRVRCRAAEIPAIGRLDSVIAMVRDLFTGVEARVKQSYVNLAAGVAPVIAPTIGVAIATLGGWRAIYGFLAAGGIILLAAVATQLDESAPSRGSHTVGTALRSYLRVLRHPVTVGYVAVIAAGADVCA